MKRTFALLVLLVSAALAWAVEDQSPLRRFAFVAGSNDGGPDLVKLKYAETDARSFAAVLQEIGGVRPGTSCSS